MTKKELAQKIDFTDLHADHTRKEMLEFLSKAKDYGFRAVCIDSGWVSLAKKYLAGTDIKVATVPNWVPWGGQARISRGFALTEADEIDYIIDLNTFMVRKDWKATEIELQEVRNKVPGKLKVICELAALRALSAKDTGSTTYEMCVKAICEIVERVGTDYIKTDSGLFTRKGGFDQLVEDVLLFKKYTKLPIKAAGFIGKIEEVNKLIDLGVSIIGASKGVALVSSIQE